MHTGQLSMAFSSEVDAGSREENASKIDEGKEKYEKRDHRYHPGQ
jgi:hypothetical protein